LIFIAILQTCFARKHDRNQPDGVVLVFSWIAFFVNHLPTVPPERYSIHMAIIKGFKQHTERFP